MRFPLLIAALLTVCACGNNDQADNTQNVDENLSAESIVSNDVTAIDAVTGDAANMAADVDMNFGNLDQNVGEEAAANTATPRAATKPLRPAPKSAPAPATNTTATVNTATNAE